MPWTVWFQDESLPKLEFSFFYERAAYFSNEKGAESWECVRIQLLTDEPMQMKYIRPKRVALFLELLS